jgi:hypothetical protein
VCTWGKNQMSRIPYLLKLRKVLGSLTARPRIAHLDLYRKYKTRKCLKIYSSIIKNHHFKETFLLSSFSAPWTFLSALINCLTLYLINYNLLNSSIMVQSWAKQD